MVASIWLWVGFNLFVLALLALDLGVFHRKAHAVSAKEATIWSVVWVTLSLLFNGAIYLFWDRLMPGSAGTKRLPRCSPARARARVSEQRTFAEAVRQSPAAA